MKTLLTIMLALLATAVQAAPPDEVEFFEKKIRPVLIQHCYECHNSLNKSKGGLALDYKAALLAGGDSGDTIVPGKPEDSILMQALRHEAGYEMPANAPKLSDAVIRDFEQWVKMGAADPRLEKPTPEDLSISLPWDQVREQRLAWWSFQPPRQHPVPKVGDAEWSENALDAFVYARMQQAELKPQPLASPEVLVRRLHLVLTGLPPRPEAAARFVADPSPKAYEQLVDELLASHAFGERWARHWMDWYRYAESHGSEGDPRIPYAQQYRDYLIRALNDDVPYDALLREHLAGDLLPQPRINKELQINESAVGPAHLRMVPHGFGVTDAYGEQIAFTDNQIDVVSKAMLGLTVSCARCHDHKFDPISQKDFYRFYGVMVSSRPSTVLIDSPEKLETNQAALAALKEPIRASFAEHWLSEVDQLPDRLRQQAEQLAKHRDPTQPLGAWTLLQDADPKVIPARVKQYLADAEQIKQDNAEAIAAAEFYVDLRDPANAQQWFTSGNGTAGQVSAAGAFALHAEGDSAIRGIYPRGIYTHLISDKHAGVFSSKNFMVRGPGTKVRAAGRHAQLRAPVRNYPLTHGGLHPDDKVDHEQLQWVGTQRKWNYWQGEQIHYELRTDRDKLPGPGNNDRSWFGVTEIFAGGRPPQPEGASLVGLVERPESIVDRASLLAAYRDTLRRVIAAWRDGSMSDAEAEFLDAFVRLGLLTNRLDRLPRPLQEQMATYRQLEAQIPVPTRSPGVLDAEPVDQPLLIRGDYKQEADPVPRQFLEIFDNRPYSDQRPGRLELAEDMIGDANTLTSRVLVNRLWAYVFGRGIVASTDNFGRLGSEPTHPELLDHLALEFEQDGWSIKRALRAMVTSRTFRSASSADGGTIEQDPENIYLSHFTPRRLDAESIHDSLQWIAGKSERAVYKPVIRNNLDPFLAAFNAPVPTSTVSRRNHTNVPVQSLTLMNGKLVEQAARVWSNRINADKTLATPQQKLTAMFQQAYGRSPSERELRLLLTYLSGEPAVQAEDAELAAEQRRLESEMAAARQAREALIAPVEASLQRELDRQHAASAEQQDAPAVRLRPIAEWDFETDAHDSVGNLRGTLHGAAKIDAGALQLRGGCLLTSPIPLPLNEKTLEVLVQLDRLDQRGGGAMTVQTLDGVTFDSIVYAEQAPREWLAGSNHHVRTLPLLGAPERQAESEPVHLVMVYESDGTIRAYRNGKPYGKAVRKQQLQGYQRNEAQVVFGLRHGVEPNQARALTGAIHAARLYDRALSPQEVAAAADGNIRPGVTREMLLKALTAEQQEALNRHEAALVRLEQALSIVRGKLSERQPPAAQGGDYVGVAHALLNSKEFIYVH